MDNKGDGYFMPCILQCLEDWNSFFIPFDPHTKLTDSHTRIADLVDFGMLMGFLANIMQANNA